jgi:hypothetical protein
MDTPVQSVSDRLMSVDRIGPDCGQTHARSVFYHGPVEQWFGFLFTQNRPVWTREPDRDPDQIFIIFLVLFDF